MSTIEIKLNVFGHDEIEQVFFEMDPALLEGEIGQTLTGRITGRKLKGVVVR